MVLFRADNGGYFYIVDGKGMSHSGPIPAFNRIVECKIVRIFTKDDSDWFGGGTVKGFVKVAEENVNGEYQDWNASILGPDNDIDLLPVSTGEEVDLNLGMFSQIFKFERKIEHDGWWKFIASAKFREVDEVFDDLTMSWKNDPMVSPIVGKNENDTVLKVLNLVPFGSIFNSPLFDVTISFTPRYVTVI